MATNAPGDASPSTPEGIDREGRIRAAISLGATMALLASYFTIWGHWYMAGPDPLPDLRYVEPLVPFTAIVDPRHGFSLSAALLLVAPAALSTLFASLTRRGSREARRLFATFSLMTGFFCLLISTGMAFLQWSDTALTHSVDAGGVVGWLASVLILGVAFSLSIALPGTSSGRQGAP
jgi:hypothetical protein